MYAARNIPGNMVRMRADRSMSAADLARELEVSRTYVGKLESGDKAPSVARLLDIARAFGCTPNELLGVK